MSLYNLVELTNPIGNITIAGTFTPKGAYDNSTDYAVGDQVDYNGSSYIMYSDAGAGTLPTNTTYWGIVASKGDAGTNGTNGTNGTDGSDGAAATVTVGTTTTGDAGTDASVTNSGSESAAVFDFTIPKGATGATGPAGADGTDGTNGTDGADGAAATIAVGTVTTGAVGSDATVTNSGTSAAAVFDFSIPQGAKGDTGSAGTNGTNGTDGEGVPTGGTTGQVLAKVDNTDFNTEWIDQTGGSGSGDMTKAVYDPNSVAADAFNQDNMVDGTTNVNYTATEQTKLAGIAAGAQVNTVASVNTKTGTVVIDPDDLDDTSTSNKFVNATDKTNLSNLDTAAYTPTTNYATAAQGALADSATQPGDLATVATSGAYSDLTGTPDLSGYELLTNKATDFTTVNDTLYPTVQAVQTAINTAVTGLLDYRGSYDASGDTYPSSGGSGTSGAILKGDFWICSVAGTLNSLAVSPGDLIIALTDTPGTTDANWDIVLHNTDLDIYALKTTTINGHALSSNVTISLTDLSVTATATELNTLDGITSTTAELNILDGVTATASELNILDGATLTTAELNYVDGVTSAIQTQLDAKVSGPASATDTAIAIYDGTTGKLIKNSAITIGSNGNISNLAGSGARTEKFGNLALTSNTGDDNTAFGYKALNVNTSGTKNVALGSQALAVNTTGGSNFGLGTFALAANVGGSSNIAIGTSALLTNVSGNFNLGIGSSALQLATGSSNIALGRNAGNTLTTGSSNILIGSVQAPTATSSSKLNIGDAIKGDLSTGNIDITGSLTAGAVAVPTISSVSTLTNKRITKRVASTADDSTAVIDSDSYDEYYLTAIANNTTISVTGTPTTGQTIFVGLKDAGTTKTLTWSSITALGVTLPTATTAGKQHIIELKYISSAWYAIAVSVES